MTSATTNKLPGGALQGGGDKVAAALYGRKWDVLLILVLLPAFAAIAHITHMLIIGDWDFWADWKDRQWWPVVSPAVGIIIPAAAQYLLWRLLGIPGGATVTALLLVLAQWASRFFTFHMWVYFPLAFVSPATMIPMAIVLDAIFLLTRSYVLTSILGGLAWGAMFQPANMVIFGAMWRPVDYNGELMTVADVMGFEYVRTQAPSYLRIVEEGHLRAFVESIGLVSAITAGIASILFYWVGYALGRYVGLGLVNVFIPTKSPLLRYLHPGESAADTPRARSSSAASVAAVEATGEVQEKHRDATV